MNRSRKFAGYIVSTFVRWYKDRGERESSRGRDITRIDSSGRSRKSVYTNCGAWPAAGRTIAASLSILAIALFLTACASFAQRSTLPSCSNVRGFYNPDIPLGAERLGSRLWVERRLIYTSQIGSVVRVVAAGPADGEWEATRTEVPLLVEDGLWKTTVPTGIASQNPYDVNFDARAWPKPEFTTARIERRTVQIYLHAFGPGLGNYGLERTVRMAALKYRGVPDTDWAICPVRL